jgi:GntR family transcriptional regulator
MSLDPHSDRAVYRQLADQLRERVNAGDWPPDTLLPSASDLARQYSTGLDTVRRALAVLRSEGLISIVPRVGATVINQTKTAVILSAPVSITARMPSDAERRKLRLSEGIPLLVVGDLVYPADRTIIDVQ